MKVGTLAYATDQGLGILARDFHRHGIVTDVMIVRHSSRPTHDEWYPDAPQTPIRPFDFQAAAKFCLSMDLMLFFETPFDWRLIDVCRQAGIKTILMPMYECTPQQLSYFPDQFLCPSLLDLKYFPKHSKFIPVPVDVPWRQRESASIFVHNAGHGGLKGRNGTVELLEAFWRIKSEAKLLLRVQDQRVLADTPVSPRVVVEVGTAPYEQLWQAGDVFIFPEKFNGLSLPLQEARAAGMLVMATDRFPMSSWLPNEPLIPTQGHRPNRIGPGYLQFSEAIVDPSDIAATVDEWYGTDISEYSKSGKEWACKNSWEALKPLYIQYLTE